MEDIQFEPHRPDQFSTGQNTITLVHLFQIVTGCGVFFACMRWSPMLAIALTVLFTPAIIRTGLIAQKFDREQIVFGWTSRIRAFSGSVVVTLVTMFTSFLVFLLVSISFGLICVAITYATVSANDLLKDIGFIGTIGGTIWGFAAAVLSLTLTQSLWKLPATKRFAIKMETESVSPTT